LIKAQEGIAVMHKEQEVLEGRLTQSNEQVKASGRGCGHSPADGQKFSKLREKQRSRRLKINGCRQL